jgi:hypothetical protein
MANRPQVVGEENISGADTPGAPVRRKRSRSASVAKPAFFVLQMLDDNGEPTAFDKSRLKLVLVERSAEKIMEIMDNSTYPHAFYLRGIVPVQRQSAPRLTPAA